MEIFRKLLLNHLNLIERYPGPTELSYINPIWHGLFLNLQSWGGPHPPHHNFVVIAPIITKFGTDAKLDVFYTMVTKTFVTSVLSRHYDVMICISADP